MEDDKTQLLLNGEMITHPDYPKFHFKLITSLAEAQDALRLFTQEAVKHTEFISQMKISADTFYEEGLQHYAEVVAEDRLSLICLDDSNQLIGARVCKDCKSTAKTPSKESNLMLRARSHLMSQLVSDLTDKRVAEKGHCVTWMVGCTKEEYHQMGLFKLMYRIWNDAMIRKGYSMEYYAAVNPITHHTAKKYSEIIDSKFVEFAQFEYEGGKPFQEFVFKNGERAGILGVLGSLNSQTLTTV